MEKTVYVCSFLMPLLIIIFGLLHTKSILGLSILLFMYGITVGFASPLFSTVISNEYNENRGAALGLFNFIRYSGMAVGGMFIGLSRILPSSYIFIFLGVLLLHLSLFQYSSLKRLGNKDSLNTINSPFKLD
ncbi:hypothetical protein AAHB53_25520 [Niallia circulans]